MLEHDDPSLIPRARAHDSECWKEVRRLPAAPWAVSEDLAAAQRKAFRALLDILDAPLSGNEQRDFLLRRNQIEAAKALLALRPALAPATFPLSGLERPEDAVAAQAAVIKAVSSGTILPFDGAEISRAIECWLRALKASKLRPFNKKENRNVAG